MIERGAYEGLKALVHALMGNLAIVCFVYNTLAFVRRQERHLLVGSVIYGLLMIWEAVLVIGHLEEWR